MKEQDYKLTNCTCYSRYHIWISIQVKYRVNRYRNIAQPYIAGCSVNNSRLCGKQYIQHYSFYTYLIVGNIGRIKQLQILLFRLFWGEKFGEWHNNGKWISMICEEETFNNSSIFYPTNVFCYIVGLGDIEIQYHDYCQQRHCDYC